MRSDVHSELLAFFFDTPAGVDLRTAFAKLRRASTTQALHMQRLATLTTMQFGIPHLAFPTADEKNDAELDALK